ncbi:MAG: hypothetical protein M1839_000888 [Geoglossum umbratile]|nr:MAG: hypothetical protein M1839_000888 [Geoglossum umbratile]
MSSRTSYNPPSAESVLDFSNDDAPKYQPHTESPAPLTTPNKLPRRREKGKEKGGPNSSPSGEKNRKKQTYRERERERAAANQTSKSPSQVHSKIRQVFAYNFTESQSEVGRKSLRPDRVTEAERLSQHRRTRSTSTLKSASSISESGHTDNSMTDEDKIVRRSSIAMYNTEKHRMSVGSISPSVISSISSLASGTTTSSGGSSGSNSTITQGPSAPRNLNGSNRPRDHRERQPDGDVTPRQREFPPTTKSPPLNVFSFMDDASEVAPSHSPDSSSATVETKSPGAAPRESLNTKGGESDPPSKPSNKVDIPPQTRSRKDLAPNYWARREWLREQAEMRLRSDSGQSPRTTSMLRTAEHQVAVTEHTPDADGRGSPTGSTSSGSDSTSGTVGDTDTTRSSSPERSPKGSGAVELESPKAPAKGRLSARTTFEPLLARQRERAATTGAREEPLPKPDAPHDPTPRRGPTGDAGVSAKAPPAASPNRSRNSSPTAQRVSSSGSIATKNVLPSKSRELVSLPATGNVAMKQKIFSAPPVNVLRARNPSEASPEHFYRAPDASTRISSDGPASRPYPPPMAPEVYFTPPHMAQRGYSPQVGPPPDYLPMPMMVPGAGMGMPPYMVPPSPIRPPSPCILDESKKSISGYELLASHLSSLSGGSGKTLVPLYRKFEALNHRLLLHLQDEISELEEELRKVDEVDAQARAAAAGIGAGMPGPASRRAGAKLGGDLEWRRLDVLGRAFIKIGQYNQALTSYTTLIKTHAPATKEDIKRYRSFMSKHAPLSEPESRFLYEEADLLAATGPNSHNHNHKQNKSPTPENPTPLPRWMSFLLGDGYMLVLAGAILMPILAFSIIPGYLGRLAFVAMVAVATVALLGESKIAGVMGGWEWGMSASMYVGVMAIIAGVVG